MEIKIDTAWELNDCVKLVNVAKEWMEEKDILKKSVMNAEEIYDYRTRVLEKLTTGSSKLDGLLGGGVETEALTEFFGIFGSGKTQVCHTMAVLAQMEKEIGGLESKILWIDTENTFIPERIVGIAIARGFAKDVEEEKRFLRNITVLRAHNASHQMTIVNNLNHFIVDDRDERSKEWEGDGSVPRIRLLIMDSLTTHFRSEYLGRGTLSMRQQQLGAMMKKLGRLAETWKMAVVYTNQVLSDPAKSMGDPIKAIGGNIVGHIST